MVSSFDLWVWTCGTEQEKAVAKCLSSVFTYSMECISKIGVLVGQLLVYSLKSTLIWALPSRNNVYFKLSSV